VRQLEKQIQALIKKEERKKKNIRDELSETEKTEQYKLWGNLLSIYAYEKTDGRKEIKVSNLFADPPEEETIPIDPRLTIAQNSQAYFKKYNKMKNRLKIGEEMLAECDGKISYLQDMAYFASEVKTKNDLDDLRDELADSGLFRNVQTGKARKKKKTTPACLTLVIDGFTVCVGRNNRENEFLTLHKAKKQDVWLHAKQQPGSHVVIETESEDVPEETLLKAASLAAWHSKGRESGKVDVDYTLIRYVRKIPGGPPGLVNYSHQKTLTVSPSSLNAKQN